MGTKAPFEVSDDPLGDRIARGKRAAQLLGDPLLEELLGEIEATLITAWTITKPDETEARERCWMTLRTVTKLRDMLERVKANGSVAQLDLDRLMAQE